MTKQLLVISAGAALAAAVLDAQTSRVELAFQQPGWTATSEYKFNVIHMNRPDGQTGPVAGKPFSAIEVRHVIQTLADGTHVDQPETTASYRDAQGRMRAEHRNRVLIYDPVAGFVYALDTRTKTYRKTPISDGTASTTIAATNSGTWVATDHSTPPAYGDVSARRMHGHNRVPPLTEDLQPQVVNGIRAKGSRVTMTVPKGTFGNDRDVNVVNERWYSDDLQVLLKSSNSDPRFGVTTYELTNIMQAPPDPSLFQVPADYTLNVEEHRR
jgi:hypothetical protein